jgi:hypothetical protein
MAERKVRITIPDDVAANVLFRSDRTCCVCHKAGKQVQIHHINDNPADNNPSNLAVLCLECHAQTQISGGFGRKLNAKLVILYRDHWLSIIEMRRTAESLESELTKDDLAHTTPVKSQADTLPATSIEIGRTFGHLGIAITLIDVDCSYSVHLNNSGYRSGSVYATYEEVTAGNGAKFVTVSTRVLNDSKTSIDLTCGYPIGNHLIDERDREFDSIGDLSHIRGNPECNDRLQPGFASDMTWIYRVPLDASISAFEFEDLTDFTRDRTVKPTRIPLAIPAPRVTA